MKPTLCVDHGFCECGCGEKTTVSHVNDKSKGWVKGEPLRFRRGHANLGRTLAPVATYRYHTLSEFELGWVAGLLEGEGSFSVKRSKRKNGFSCTPAIQLTSTDEDVAVRLHKLIPAASVCKPRRKTKGGKRVYKWSLSRSAVVSDLLICIFPLMSGRRQDKIREVLAHPTFERY